MCDEPVDNITISPASYFIHLSVPNIQEAILVDTILPSINWKSFHVIYNIMTVWQIIEDSQCDESIRSSQRQMLQNSDQKFRGPESFIIWNWSKAWMLHKSKDGPVRWYWEVAGGLQPPGSQTDADKPHPHAWTVEEITERLAVTRHRIDALYGKCGYTLCLGGEFVYCGNEGDHPEYSQKVLCGPRKEWRQSMETWLDDVQEKQDDEAGDQDTERRPAVKSELDIPSGNHDDAKLGALSPKLEASITNAR